MTNEPTAQKPLCGFRWLFFVVHTEEQKKLYCRHEIVNAYSLHDNARVEYTILSDQDPIGQGSKLVLKCGWTACKYEP